MRTCTLLHLTDLHFGPASKQGHWWNSQATERALPKHDQRGLLGSLIDDLQTQNITPDVIIVSGDVLDRGAKSGIAPALQFLSRLAEAYSMHRDRVVMVPGNHDILRTKNSRDRYSAFDRIRNEFYQHWRPSFPSSVAAHHRVELFDFSAELGIQIVGFNSCENLNHPDSEHGSLGNAQRAMAEQLLRGTNDRDFFRIAVMHHHLASPAGVLLRQENSVMEDAAMVRSWLANMRFRLVMHGHHHVDWQEISIINDWYLSITAGASAGVGGYGRDAWSLRLGYQLVFIESPTSGTRERREYDPQQRKWISAGRGNPKEVLQFGDARAMASTSHITTRVPSHGVFTPRQLRKAMAEVLKIDSEFTSFCSDYFPSTKREFGAGMVRTDRETLLLESVDHNDILSALRQAYPEELGEFERRQK